jgi:cyclopropane-fatty-acyl-phospholipid synthase
MQSILSLHDIQEYNLLPQLLEILLRAAGPREYSIVLWDGRELGPEPGCSSHFTLRIREPGLLGRLALRPSMATLGEAYVRGDVALEGDMLAAFSWADRLINADPTPLRRLVHAWSMRPTLSRAGARLHAAPGSKARTQAAVRFHYDMPRSFFQTWLDEQMVYSCAYYQTPDDELETAQRQKLDHICNKLMLQPGHRFLDVGSGWGALLIHAARRGADATGITLSPAQAGEATARIAAAGLSDRCRVRVADFADLPADERFDRIASVGMIEHVRERQQSAYFARLYRALRPAGLLLNHGITCTPSRPLRGGNVFLQRHVFPDHQLVPVSRTLALAEQAGFEIRDVEQLREHYQITLMAWFHRLRAAGPEVAATVGLETLRTFELYLLGMAYHFGRGNLQIHQALLAKPARGDAGLPLTRAHLYRDG